jgi:hypothetical protein
MRQEQQEKSLLFMVVVGYIVTFTVASKGGTRYSITPLLMGIIFGVVYLIPGFFETEVLQRFSANMRNAIFFPAQVAMAFGIGWTLGPGGNWLIGLSLAGLPCSHYLLVQAGWCMQDCSRRSCYPSCVSQRGISH